MGRLEGTDPSDKELVLAYQRGDRSAYDALYRKHRSRVRAVCARMLRDPQDADEAVQETFLRAYRHLGRFNGQYQLSAWLTRIATNVCVDQLRVKNRTSVVGLPEDIEDHNVDEGPEAAIAQADPRVRATIGSIRPLHADALKLRAVDGMSHEEIAKRLSLTPAQVKALLHRARGSFKKAWDKAEGWAFAPVFALRQLFGGRDAPPVQTAILGDSGGFVLEKVAATVVIAAMAISGAPTETPGPPTSVPAQGGRHGLARGADHADDPRFGHAVAEERSSAAQPQEHAAPNEVEEALEDLLPLDQLEVAATKPEEEPAREEESSGPNDKESSPTGGAQQASKEGVATVRKAAQKAGEDLGQITP